MRNIGQVGIVAIALAIASSALAQTQPKVQVTVNVDQPAAPATPPPAPAKPAAANADNGSDPDKIVCRREPVTGSRFIKRVCMTQAKWDELSRKTQEFLQQEEERSLEHQGFASFGPSLGGN